MSQRPDGVEHRDVPACPYCAAPVLEGGNASIECAGCSFAACERCIVPSGDGQSRLCDACRMTGAHRSKDKGTSKGVMQHILRLITRDTTKTMLRYNLERFAKIQRAEIFEKACRLSCPSCAEGNTPKLMGRVWVHTEHLAGEWRNGRCAAQRIRFALAREESAT